MTYDTKLTLHVPCVAKESGGLVKINYEEFKSRLIKALADVGVNSYYTQAATGYYDGAEYDEVLWTVYCEKQDGDKIAEALCRTFRESNDILKQEAFAYERNGVMTVENLI